MVRFLSLSECLRTSDEDVGELVMSSGNEAMDSLLGSQCSDGFTLGPRGLYEISGEPGAGKSQLW